MDIFKKNKLLIISVIVLALLNIATLITIWFSPRERKPHFPDHHQPQQRIIRNLLINELHLSDIQMHAFEKSGDIHFHNSRAILDKIHKNKTDMFDELFKDIPDTTKISGYLKEIGTDQSELEKLTFDHFLELKKLCNQEQKIKFKSLLKDMLMAIEPSRQLPEPPLPPPISQPPGE